MERTPDTLLHDLATVLRSVDYASLPVSDYNKRYIAHLLPAMDYYLEIYYRCLTEGIRMAGKAAGEMTLVDYGGGSGFLSLLAAKMGFGQIIYIDLNPHSAETMRVLKGRLGIGPGVILTGNADTLADWCGSHQVRPQLLVATDLIEHVYDLSAFFGDLCRISDGMQMIFTTASTPYQPLVKRRLHRYMRGCESGTLESPNYYTLRTRFIERQYPSFPEKEVQQWATATRGLVYEDITKAIESGRMPVPDKHNTCDPATGNWTERILPIRRYREILSPYGYTLSVGKGFYNSYRSGRVSSFLAGCINAVIRFSGKAGFFLSPFIVLYMRKE